MDDNNSNNQTSNPTTSSAQSNAGKPAGDSKPATPPSSGSGVPSSQPPFVSGSTNLPSTPPSSMLPSNPVATSTSPSNPTAQTTPPPPPVGKAATDTPSASSSTPPPPMAKPSTPTPPAPMPPPASAASSAASAISTKRSGGGIGKYIVILLLVLLLGGGGYFAYQFFVNGTDGSPGFINSITGLFTGQTGQGTTSQQVTLTYWGLWEPPEVMQPFIDEYQASHPNVTINYENSSPTEYAQRLRSALEKESGGPDIFRIHNTWTYTLPNLSTIPSDIYSVEQYQNTFYPIAYQNLNKGGDLIAIPLMFDGLALYYNVDLFNTAGVQPPTDWQSFQTAATKLTVKNGNEVVISGAAMGSAGGIEYWPDILSVIMFQNRTDPGNATNQLAYDAMTYYSLFSYSYNTWNKSWPSAVEAFGLGKVGMMFAPSYRVFDVKNVAKENNVDLNFRVIPIPQLPETNITWASYWAEAVSSKSPNQREAWEFLKFLSEKDTMQRMFQAQSKIREFGEIPSRKDLAEQYKDHPYIGPYVLQASSARAYPLAAFTTDKEGFNDRIIKYYETAVGQTSRGTAPQGPLSTAVKGVKQVFADYQLGT